MGGRGSSSGKTSASGEGSGSAESAIRNQLAGNQVDLDYARMKASEYGNVTGGGTRRTREMFMQWNDEVKRLQDERQRLETAQSAMDRLTKQVAKKSGDYTKPTFKMNSDGNIEFEYEGKSQYKREKGGKMQSSTKADTVERITSYFGTILIGKGTAKIERKSKVKSETVLKRGRL